MGPPPRRISGLKSLTGVLTAARLIRPVRSAAFCPACRGWPARTDDAPQGARQELDPAAVTVLLVLLVAALAWIFMIRQSGAMAATGAMGAGGAGAADTMGAAGMKNGLASLPSFAASWLIMMAAMMLPTVVPVVYEFAHTAERRRGRQVAAVALGAAYLSDWLVFGVLCYLVYSAVDMPPTAQRPVGGCALLFAAIYAMTPVARAGEASCRERCALHQSLPFNLVFGALVAGWKYGLSCIRCTAGLMVAAVVIGMSSPGWMLIISGLVLVYKLAPPPAGRPRLLVSLAIAAAALAYMVLK